MLKCREVSALLSAQLDRKLGLGERIGLRLHLAICNACSRVEGQLKFLRQAVSRLPQLRRDPDRS